MDGFDDALIELVRECELLYNKHSSGYTNTSLKSAKWLEISTRLGYPDEECIRRWKTLRDRYTKELKKLNQLSENETVTQTWHLFDTMDFLRPHVAPRRSRSKFGSYQLESKRQCLESPESNDNKEPEVAGLEERNISTSPTPSTCTSGAFSQDIDNTQEKFFKAVTMFQKFVQSSIERPQPQLTDNERFGKIVVNALDLLTPTDQKAAKRKIFSLLNDFMFPK